MEQLKQKQVTAGSRNKGVVILLGMEFDSHTFSTVLIGIILGVLFFVFTDGVEFKTRLGFSLFPTISCLLFAIFLLNKKPPNYAKNKIEYIIQKIKHGAYCIPAQTGKSKKHPFSRDN